MTTAVHNGVSEEKGEEEMIKLYDMVTVLKTGKHGAVVEIDDDGGTKPPIYLVEVLDKEKPVDADVEDVVFWCDYDEIQELDKEEAERLLREANGV